MKEQLTWELVNPEGVTQDDPLRLTVHPRSLENKTVLLHWNGKHNGDLFLDRIGLLLSERISNINIVRDWEVAPETAVLSNSPAASKDLVNRLSEFKPDLVIGAQGD